MNAMQRNYYVFCSKYANMHELEATTYENITIKLEGEMCLKRHTYVLVFCDGGGLLMLCRNCAYLVRTRVVGYVVCGSQKSVFTCVKEPGVTDMPSGKKLGKSTKIFYLENIQTNGSVTPLKNRYKMITFKQVNEGKM